MPRPLPLELRQRVVDAYNNGEGTYAEIGARFGVGVASVNRWVNRFSRTGSLEPSPAGGARRARIITEEGAAHLLRLLEDDPTWTTQELADDYKDIFGVEVSRHTIGRELARRGISFKRGSFVRQQVEDLT